MDRGVYPPPSSKRQYAPCFIKDTLGQTHSLLLVREALLESHHKITALRLTCCFSKLLSILSTASFRRQLAFCPAYYRQHSRGIGHSDDSSSATLSLHFYSGLA